MPFHNTSVVHVTMALLCYHTYAISPHGEALPHFSSPTYSCAGPPVSNCVVLWFLSCLEDSCGDDIDKVC